MEKNKKCSKCEKEFPATVEFFSKNATNPDGLERWCKDCKKKAQKAYRDAKKKGKDPQKIDRRNPYPRKPPAHKDLWPGGEKITPPRLCRDFGGQEITRATPEQIVGDLRRGFAIELIAIIQEKYGL